MRYTWGGFLVRKIVKPISKLIAVQLERVVCRFGCETSWHPRARRRPTEWPRTVRLLAVSVGYQVAADARRCGETLSGWTGSLGAFPTSRERAPIYFSDCDNRRILTGGLEAASRDANARERLRCARLTREEEGGRGPLSSERGDRFRRMKVTGSTARRRRERSRAPCEPAALSPALR